MYLTCFESCGGWIGGDDLIHRDADRRAARRVDVHLHRLAVEVARLRRPALTLSHVRRQLHGLAVAPMKGLEPVEQGLHPIVPGWDVLEAAGREPEDGITDDCRFSGLQAVDVDPEYRTGGVGTILVRLEPRFFRAIVGDEQEHSTVQRCRAALRRKGDRERERSVVAARTAGEPAKGGEDKRGDRAGGQTTVPVLTCTRQHDASSSRPESAELTSRGRRRQRTTPAGAGATACGAYVVAGTPLWRFLKGGHMLLPPSSERAAQRRFTVVIHASRYGRFSRGPPDPPVPGCHASG